MDAIEARIAKLEERLKQEKAKKAKLVAQQKAAESKKKRAEDTRRKILVGAAILAKVERGEWPEDKLRQMMDQVLTKDADRVLFGLSTENQGQKS